MLTALTDDLLALPGIELIVMSDDRFSLHRLDSRIETIKIGSGNPFQKIWRDCLHRCDAVWPIAPETGGILERLCLDVEQAGKMLLNSPSSAVRLAASKLETARRLAEFGLPVVKTVPLNEWKPQQGHPFVVKPDDGAGCEGARIVRQPALFLESCGERGLSAQPFLAGDSLSLSVLFAHGKARLLSCNRQLIDQDGEGFVLNGCLVNAVIAGPERKETFQILAERVAHAIPELWGYAGIDLIQIGEGSTILEINPRLTTSYAGLRSATAENPAALVLDLLKSGKLPPRRTQSGRPVEIRLEKPHFR